MIDKENIIEKLDNLSSKVHKDLVEFSVTGENNVKGLALLMTRVNWLWHDTLKGICKEMPEMKSVANLFVKTDEKLRANEPNAKLRAIARIKNWLTFLEGCFAILEEREE